MSTLKRNRSADPGKKWRLLFLRGAVLLVLAVQGCSPEPVEPVIGRQIPDFLCRRLGGSPQELSRHRGSVILIRFWADWCRDCVREMPVIEKYYRSAKDRGFTVLAINVMQPQSDVQAFVRNLELSFPVCLDEDGKITKAYGVKGIPSHFVIDRGGILRQVHFGPVGDESKLIRFLEPFL